MSAELTSGNALMVEVLLVTIFFESFGDHLNSPAGNGPLWAADERQPHWGAGDNASATVVRVAATGQFNGGSKSE